MRTPGKRRHAAEDLRSTNPGKKVVRVKPGEEIEDDDLKTTKDLGRKSVPSDTIQHVIPDPETEKGRSKLVQKLETDAGDLLLRSRLIERALKDVAKTTTREEFRNQLNEVISLYIKLKKNDVVGFANELVNVLKIYEETRGRKLEQKVIDYLKSARTARVFAYKNSKRTLKR